MNIPVMRKVIAMVLLSASITAFWVACAQHKLESRSVGKVMFKPCRIEGVKDEHLCAIYEVFENRHTKNGRKLPLKIVFLPAQQPHPDQGPIFYMAGGPGESATELTNLVLSWGDNEEHDVVLIDERGTGDGHRLDCKTPGSDDNLESYLNGPFDAASARVCREELSKRFDLTQYTTPNFADDIDEIRAAMGYDKININAGSFGTYAAQIYMRQHGEHVRAAYLNSLVTLMERVPLRHAANAQAGLDQLFQECDGDTACHKAYPRLREDFATLLGKLRDKPAETFVRHPATGVRTKIHLTERTFADAVRVIMYRNPRSVPFLIEQAAAGDFSPFAEAGLRANRGVYSGGSMGLYYCITCGEFVSRINPDEIEQATQGSFLGAWRVRAQMAACNEWPKTELPSDFFEPFQLDNPAVVVSGSDDSASPPATGEEAKKFLPNAIHIIVPGAGHTPETPCLRSIRHELFRAGTTTSIDTTCNTTKVAVEPFKLPH